jgi:hypothetical protein
MGAIPWWGYLLVWIVSFSAFLTIYFCQINQAVIKNKDGFGYKINFYLIIVFFLVFSIVSIIPIINILCLLEAFTDQAYKAIYAFISQQTKEKQI